MKKLTVLALVLIAAALVSACLAFAQQAAEEAAPYPGDIVYKKSGSPVIFSHEMHVGGMGLECSACHGDIFEVRAYAAEDAGDFTMREMYDGRYCGACHNGEDAFAASDFTRCESCHVTSDAVADAQGVGRPVKGPDETIKLGADYSLAEFRHASHSPFSCSDCHTGIFPMKATGTVTTMDEINAGRACGSCHNGEKAFGADQCGMCHPGM